MLTLFGHTSGVSYVCFGPDGKRLVTVSWDGSLKLWDPLSGGELLTLSSYGRQFASVAFSLDGRRLVSGSRDGIVRVYCLDIEDLIALAAQRVTRFLTPQERLKFLHEKNSVLREFPWGFDEPE